jgi:sulfonate transport system substrate-binding protein
VAITGKGENDTELLFRHAGIKPDYPISYTRFQSGHLVVEAMNSGALDLGGMSEILRVRRGLRRRASARSRSITAM